MGKSYGKLIISIVGIISIGIICIFIYLKIVQKKEKAKKKYFFKRMKGLER